MQAYKVIVRAHRRTTMLTQDAIASDGTRIQVKQAGPMVTYMVGDVIEDIRMDELEAFPDRFQPATAAEVDAWHERQAHMPMVMRAPGLNPEQAMAHADLTRQIQELEAKQQALLADAQTPVPVEIPLPDHEQRPGPRRTTTGPVSQHTGMEPESPAGRGPHAGPVPATPAIDPAKK